MKEVTLFGPDGRPVDRAELLVEQAAAKLTSIRHVFTSFIAPGLTPEGLGGVLKEAVEGNAHAYLTLAEEMEERDLHYMSVLGTRKRAVSGIPIEVSEPPNADATERKIADFVREVLSSPTASNLVSEMMDAVAKGFSAIEIIWDTSGAQWIPKAYKHRDPRFFRFDLDTREELRLLTDAEPAFGESLKRYHWIVHYPLIKTGIPIRGGLARPASAAFMCKSFDLKDWMAFAEVYGMPVRLGRFNPGASDEDIQTLLQALANIGSDAAAAVPSSMKIDISEGVRGDGLIFEGLATYWDKQVSKGIIGQTMTADDGSSLGQALVHQGVLLDIAVDDAGKAAHTIARDLVTALVDLNFGRQRRYPVVQLPIKKPEDLKTLGDILPAFIDRGLEVGQDSMRRKLGVPTPADGEKLLQAATKKEPAAPAPAQAPELNTRQTPSGEDEIDRLRDDALGDWKPMIEPIEKTVLDLAARCTSYEEFRAGLDRLNLDASLQGFINRLALAMFKAGVDGAEA